MTTLGLLAAFGAMIGWAIGDYSIEQATRRIGDIKTLFFIGFGGFIGLFPFIYKEITKLFLIADFKILILFGLVGFISAIFLFEALKQGKISIIEPVFGLELPVVIILSIWIAGEKLDWLVYLLSALVFAGLILAVTRWEHLNFRRNLLEKGVLLAVVGSIGMGMTDFLTGTTSRNLSPMLTIWFLHSFIGFAALIYLLVRGGTGNLIKDFVKNPVPVLSVTIFDNLAWICYGYAMVFLPIAIATTISESYIVLVVLLGLFINKEKIQKHQIFGIILVIISVLLLAHLVEY
jgi:drug/metabolite transporter (DMT)-like permease